LKEAARIREAVRSAQAEAARRESQDVVALHAFATQRLVEGHGQRYTSWASANG
jgi:hypothetical protein